MTLARREADYRRGRFQSRRRDERPCEAALYLAAAAARPIKAVSFVISGYINGISGSRLVDLPIF